ncbi:hypothetical protein V6N12_050319 [Hibiscus sabdariffa]|uniref:Uncharacterized protein n=1 Tax=Hibiscus sabdariffa TaxID=183260 RepID=A0ABR2GCM3_9ROSI
MSQGEVNHGSSTIGENKGQASGDGAQRLILYGPWMVADTHRQRYVPKPIKINVNVGTIGIGLWFISLKIKEDKDLCVVGQGSLEEVQASNLNKKSKATTRTTLLADAILLIENQGAKVVPHTLGFGLVVTRQ